MKVELLTLNNIKNYGSVLQTIASENLLREYFDDVETFRYVRPNAENSKLVETWLENEKGIKKVIKKIMYSFLIRKYIEVFEVYMNEKVKMSSHTYHNMDDFRKNELSADAFCVGSDQVWNSTLNGGSLPEFFLEFLKKNEYRFTLCSSFGKSKLDLDEVDLVSTGLSKFSRISVREKSAQEILDNIGIYDSVHLLDPTLLMKEDFWNQYLSKKVIKEDYILVYQLNLDPQFDEYVANLAKYKKIKLIRIVTRYQQIKSGRHFKFVPPVPEFLSLIKNARYIVTDSFHGTAFSMNFNKQFIVIYPHNFSTRLQSILEWAGLENRRVSDFNDYKLVDEEIDYISINTKLKEERKKARDYLESVLKDISEKENIKR